jgi:N-acetylmuramoyl-L-alanine amidase
MAIKDHWITGLARQPLVHKGTTQTPRLVVLHYSVTDTIDEAVRVLNRAGLGYHILIGKDGRAVQTRPLTETAAHPGLSNWKRTEGVTLDSSVQRGSVGICLMNTGFAHGPRPSAPGQLIYRPADPAMQSWEVYPPAQIAAARAIAAEVIGAYPVWDVVGHHDVAINGKFDPGPLFDLDPLRALVTEPRSLGLKTRVRTGIDFLNLRPTIGTDNEPLQRLAPGTRLWVRSIAYNGRAGCVMPNPPSKKRYLSKWASVGLDGSDRHAGFVHLSGLEETPLAPSLAGFL